uniref:Uncharacterized protein n=1 Tax=Triticum urartu TaxID=4572 RepID=A0A8R7TFL4_TRIUA
MLHIYMLNNPCELADPSAGYVIQSLHEQQWNEVRAEYNGQLRTSTVYGSHLKLLERHYCWYLSQAYASP